MGEAGLPQSRSVLPQSHFEITNLINYNDNIIIIPLIAMYDLQFFFHSLLQGHTRKISIPDCVEFHMTTNACRGYCDSWAVPSGPKANPFQPITSVGQCCNIVDSEVKEANVLCIDGMRKLQFQSAKKCSCYYCKKD